MAANFDAMSTCDDVLAGTDLRGRRILLTGASAGIGLETARALTAHGATVVGTTRNLESARATPLAGLELVELDLASLASVRRCAGSLLRAGGPLDVIIANAGLMAGPKVKTVDGFEAQWGTNYMGHFVLINQLAGLLRPGGRIVMVSSAGHRRADVDLNDPNFDRTPYNEYVAYARSKTATILFAVEFDRRYRAQGVRATSVHPGAIQTDTVKQMIETLGAGKEAAVAAYTWKTAAQGAATTVWAACVALAEEIAARYCEDCRVADINDDPAAKNGVRSYALDPERARALWARGEEMAGEHFPAP